jgi:hypothetical protein
MPPAGGRQRSAPRRRGARWYLSPPPRRRLRSSATPGRVGRSWRGAGWAAGAGASRCQRRRQRRRRYAGREHHLRSMRRDGGSRQGKPTNARSRTRRAVHPGNRLPDQLYRVGVGAKQAHDVTRQLSDIAVVEAALQASQEPGPDPLRRRVGNDRHDLTVDHGGRIKPEILLSSYAAPVGQPVFPVCHAHVRVAPSILPWTNPYPSWGQAL